MDQAGRGQRATAGLGAVGVQAPDLRPPVAITEAALRDPVQRIVDTVAGWTHQLDVLRYDIDRRRRGDRRALDRAASAGGGESGAADERHDNGGDEHGSDPPERAA